MYSTKMFSHGLFYFCIYSFWYSCQSILCTHGVSRTCRSHASCSKLEWNPSRECVPEVFKGSESQVEAIFACMELKYWTNKYQFTGNKPFLQLNYFCASVSRKPLYRTYIKILRIKLFMQMIPHGYNSTVPAARNAVNEVFKVVGGSNRHWQCCTDLANFSLSF